MFAQLGNIVFKGLYGPSDLRFDGDEVNFAQFDLINNKPTLQQVGVSLIEVSATILMNVNFCNIETQLQQMNTYKLAGEVLPLLMGNGKYIGDFVIVSNVYSVDESFADGTHKQITITLSLKEYRSINKLEQKQLAAKKKAFAVGDKKPVILRSPQPPTVDQEIAKDITESKLQSNRVDAHTRDMQINPNKITADKILNAAQKGRVSVTSMTNKLNNNIDVLSNNPDLKTAGEVLLGSFNNVITAYPFSDITTAIGNNTELQATTRSFSRASTALLQKIIIRE